MRKPCVGVFVLALVLAPFFCFAAEDPPLIPLELLLGDPVKANPQISPDGTRLAYLAPLEGVLNVWIQDLGKTEARPLTQDQDRGIRDYFWAHDRRHLLYLQDKNGNENWRLYAVDTATGEVKDLTPFEGTQVGMLALDKHFPNDVMVTMNKENPQFHDAYRIDLETGGIRLEAKNPGKISQWICDSSLKIRGALFARDDGGYDLAVREHETSEWRTVAGWGLEDSLASGPVSFSKDGKALYLKDSRGSDTARLVKLDIDSGKMRVLAGDPRYDIADCLIHPDTYEVRMVLVIKDRMEWVLLERGLGRDLKALKRLRRGDIMIRSGDNADEKWIVGFAEDQGPVSFYLYDRRTRKGTFLFSNQPDLAKYRLNAMKPIRFNARDGFEIHGYLTSPGTAKQKNMPLVLLVHGGPWSRDVWGYHPVVQWIANRGYACLQVNFRGSAGFGKKFINAGNREWGGTMQEDLTDAVQWAVNNKLADPGRVAIFGASYGGYAALAGAAFTPDLYRCAVDAVGPSNLLTFLKSIPPFWATERAMIYARVGNPDTDEELLKARSPFFAADRIKIPVLIAQGANDPRVQESESRQIAQALEQKGVEHEYILFPDEGHWFARPGNRLKFYRAAEKFLARHLGGEEEGWSQGKA